MLDKRRSVELRRRRRTPGFHLHEITSEELAKITCLNPRLYGIPSLLARSRLFPYRSSYSSPKFDNCDLFVATILA
jgi:hypothetical protein